MSKLKVHYRHEKWAGTTRGLCSRGVPMTEPMTNAAEVTCKRCLERLAVATEKRILSVRERPGPGHYAYAQVPNPNGRYNTVCGVEADLLDVYFAAENVTCPFCSELLT